MTSNKSERFTHKKIRLPAARYRGRQAYFVTLCFHDRDSFGKDTRIANWLIDNLRKHSGLCGFFIHAYCVMPDHLNILASADAESSNLVKFVEGFKQETAIQFERKHGVRLWQFKYYDRVLRSYDSLDRVAWYISLNPVRKGLCTSPADYQFLGAFTEIGRKLLRSAAPLEWTPPWKSAALKAAALRLNPSGH